MREVARVAVTAEVEMVTAAVAKWAVYTELGGGGQGGHDGGHDGGGEGGGEGGGKTPYGARQSA